jgi:hypothetical protein
MHVHLSLVSGRPISFSEDLYTSYYLKRPEVQPQLIMSIRPVNYQTGVTDADTWSKTTRTTVSGAAMSYTTDDNMPSANANFSVTLAPSLSPVHKMNDAAFNSTVVSTATAHDLGEGFEYAIKDPVTLARQKSAMLPIVSGPIKATQLSIYNPQVQQQYALYGARIKNITGLHLMGGPITVYNHGVYAGDATFEDLQPGADRLISYAVDLGVTPLVKNADTIDQITAMKIVDGNISITSKYRRAVTYHFDVKDGKARTMLVEYPYQSDWNLVSPAKVDETTDSLYRFTVPVSADKGGVLTVTEEKGDVSVSALADMENQTILYYAATIKLSKPLHDALVHVADIRRRLADLRAERSAYEEKINSISHEQDRLRKDMGVLDHSNDLYKRYVAKMNSQETLIEAHRANISALLLKEAVVEKELRGYVNGLNLSTML